MINRVINKKRTFIKSHNTAGLKSPRTINSFTPVYYMRTSYEDVAFRVLLYSIQLQPYFINIPVIIYIYVCYPVTCRCVHRNIQCFGSTDASSANKFYRNVHSASYIPDASSARICGTIINNYNFRYRSSLGNYGVKRLLNKLLPILNRHNGCYFHQTLTILANTGI